MNILKSHEDQVVSVIKDIMPTVVSIVVGKDYDEILRKQPYQLVVPFNEQYGAIMPEDELPHTKDGKIRIGGGSGFIIDPSGLILTNKHVVVDPEAEYLVALGSEDTHKARVLARDPLNDVAVLKIEKTGLPAIPIGNSDRVQLGQTVLAIGTALGEFQNTVSLGIISGLSRFLDAITDMEGHSERLRGLIQTDAAINPGNSGGPMVNLDGEVVGINTAVVFGAQNIGFAIPINKAHRDLEELKRHGRIRRPFLGVRYMLVNELVKKRFGLTVDHGALVLREGIPGRPAVVSESPAAKAGLAEGDIITAINGTNISRETGIEDVLENIELGSAIRIDVLREGKPVALDCKAEERPL